MTIRVLLTCTFWYQATYKEGKKAFFALYTTPSEPSADLSFGAATLDAFLVVAPAETVTFSSILTRSPGLATDTRTQ